jgi:uncharacterized protein (DUF2062 family)
MQTSQVFVFTEYLSRQEQWGFESRLMLGHLLLLQNTGHLVALGLAAGVAPQLQMMVSNPFQQSAKK